MDSSIGRGTLCFYVPNMWL